MISPRPDRATPAEQPVHRERNADREPANAERQTPTRLGFDDEMYVVGLDGELDDTEVRIRRAR